MDQDNNVNHLDEIVVGKVFENHDEAIRIIEEWSEANFCPLTKVIRLFSIRYTFENVYHTMN